MLARADLGPARQEPPPQTPSILLPLFPHPKPPFTFKTHLIDFIVFSGHLNVKNTQWIFNYKFLFSFIYFIISEWILQNSTTVFCVKSVILQSKGEKLPVRQGRFWRGILPYLIYQNQLLFEINVSKYATKKKNSSASTSKGHVSSSLDDYHPNGR